MAGSEGANVATHRRDIVLVVEDYVPALIAIQVALEAVGLVVLGLNSTSSALEILHAGVAGLKAIVTDLRLHDGSGWELARHVRAMEGLSQVPILIVTGVNPEDPHLQRALALPRVTFLAKPHSVEQLRDLVRGAIALEA